jgi:hypothetical protein
MRDPMDRSQRLTDGTRWRTFMRLLRFDDLMTSYTNARPGAGLLVVDLDLGTASGLLMLYPPELRASIPIVHVVLEVPLSND